MKIKTLSLLLILSASVNNLVSQNPFVQNVLNEVRLDSLTYYVRELSGDISTVIGDSAVVILSRHKDNPGNELAFEYIKQKIQSFGLIPDSQQFSPTGKNIFCEKKGLMFPERKFIICAHYDNMPVTNIAPGADDNASGTAAVIEAMRVLSKYDFPNTIVFALWDEEEQGLVGSNYYAALALAEQVSILGVINLDMIAWDGNDDKRVLIHTRTAAKSVEMANIVNSANSLYSTGLNIEIRNPGTGASDHSSFWYNGFSAIGLSEDYYSDFNPYYHTPNDHIIHFNFPFYEKLSKLAIASLASLASDTASVLSIEEKKCSDCITSTGYPNPFKNKITINYTLSSLSDVSVIIYNSIGDKVHEISNRNLSSGNHNIIWNATGFPGGVYFYEITGFSGDGKKIFSKQVNKIALMN